MSTVRSLSRTSGRGLGPVIYYSKVRLREGQVERLSRLGVFVHHPVAAHHSYAYAFLLYLRASGVAAIINKTKQNKELGGQFFGPYVVNQVFTTRLVQ